MTKNQIALEPRKIDLYQEAILSSGGQIAPLTNDVKALVWTDYSRPDLLEKAVAENSQLRWVQLPFAGVDAFSKIIANNPQIIFTSAKRSYSEPVAEHALMLCMALGRALPERIRATSWGKKFAVSIFDEEVLIVGGGGIAQQLVELLEPFRSKVKVLRKRPEEPFQNSKYSSVAGFESLDSELSKARFVIVACALTEETRFLFNSQRFMAMRDDAYLVNVARGEVINQEDLVSALQKGEIAGAAVDVTYPEPLPDNHPMWAVENLIITPHSADTPEIVKKLFASRLRENVSAWIANNQLVGVVDPTLGY